MRGPSTYVRPDIDDFRKVVARIDERFNRIEAILVRHQEMLQAVPARLKREIGFRVPE